MNKQKLYELLRLDPRKIPNETEFWALYATSFYEKLFRKMNDPMVIEQTFQKIHPKLKGRTKLAFEFFYNLRLDELENVGYWNKVVKKKLRENMKAKLVRESLNEGKMPIPEFTTGWEVISFLRDIPEFDKYYNDEAQYDDIYFEIPAKVFHDVLGWTAEDVRNINYELESYEGSISWDDEDPDKRNERDQIISWKPRPFEDQWIVVHGGA